MKKTGLKSLKANAKKTEHFQADIAQVKAYLHGILKARIDAGQREWLEQQVQKVQAGVTPGHLYLAFSSAARHFPKTPLKLSETEIAEADALRHGFQPQYWNVLQTVRTFFLLMLPVEPKETYLSMLGQVLETADMNEQQAIYAALPLLPYPQELVYRAREGLRTNMVCVFEAVACHNPYPADFLPEPAWNQMVLKAVFIESVLYRIYGADRRANRKLAEMLLDLVHERWAAGRKVTPEAWRFIGPFIDADSFADIETLAQSDNAVERDAALLACAASDYLPVHRLLQEHPKSYAAIVSGQLNWQDIGIRHENQRQSNYQKAG